MYCALMLLTTVIFSVSAFICAEHQVNTTTVKGEATILFCESDLNNETLTLTWTKDNHTLQPSPRIRIQGQLLWLLNTTLSDGGLYVCLSTNSTFSMESRTLLDVKDGLCPYFENIKLILEEDNFTISCNDEVIPVLGQIMEVQWWKDCKSTGKQGIDFNLYNVSMSDEGNYTCKVIFRYEDINYTASYPFQVTVIKKEPVKKPRVLQPRNKTLHVKPGKLLLKVHMWEELKLECTVFIGIGEETKEETNIYWMINDNFIEAYPELKESLIIETRENVSVFGHSTLSISKVLPEFFGVPFQCTVLNPSGGDMGLVWLSQDDNTIHSWLIIVSLLISVTVVGAVLLIVFKIDLILAYRLHCGKNKTPQEERPYNAYVLYLQCKCPGSSSAEDLALRILPKMLEQQHHLKLFIQGRDTETEVGVTNISDVLSQSKVVVLILPGNDGEENLIPLNQGQNRLEESQLAGLFSDITSSGVPLLLVESGENADYSLMPESIQSIIKKDRVLKWKPTVQPNGHFWKKLRYHMT
ncbi:interleukin-1 receptor type 1-like [Silurus meridionalis]|nr:interleukin-1 receptor type 1-like [Silurus meridionalis]